MKKRANIFIILIFCIVFLTLSALADQYGVVNYDSVRFRRKAESTDVWAMLNTGWPVTILNTKTVGGVAYYYVAAGTPNNPNTLYWGYIQQRYVTITGAPVSAAPVTTTTTTTTTTAAATASTAQGGYLQFTVKGVNLRSGPSTGSKSLDQFKLDEIVAYTGSTESNGRTWYQVSKGDKTGYVLGTCVRLVSGPDAASASGASPESAAVAVTPAASSAASAASASAVPVITAGNVALTAMEKVIVRASGQAKGAQIKLLNSSGQVCTLLGATNESDGYTWYEVKVKDVTGWIRGDLLRFLSAEESAALTASGASPEAAPASSVSSSAPVATAGNVALTTMEKVIVRASGQAKGAQIKLLNSSGQVCTLLGATNESDGYTWYQVNVKNVTGWIRGDLLSFLSAEESAALTASGSASSSSSTVLYTPELADWETSSIQRIFYKGCVATVTDVKTGISFQVKRWSGGSHADVEPLTAADTAAMCRIYGVSTAQEIADKDLYQRRAILVTVSGHSYAASMYGEPHNYPEGDTIANNNFRGQFCIHFTGSKTHGSAKVDADHQTAVNYAYTNAVTSLTKYGYTFQ